MAAAAASLRASSGAAHNGEAVAHALHGGYASALDALLRNRAVRDFLAVFPEAQWERAVKLTLLYGISALRAHYRHSQLTLPFLEELLRRDAAALAVEDAVPEISDRLAKLQSQIEQVQTELRPASSAHSLPPAATATPSAPAEAAPVEGVAVRRRRHGRGSKGRKDAHRPKAQCPKPSHAWRDGDHASVEALLSGEAENDADIVEQPDSARAGSSAAAAVAAPKHTSANRQPRLAYSTPPAEAKPSPADDDLVTAKYLGVKSSGYGLSRDSSSSGAAVLGVGDAASRNSSRPPPAPVADPGQRTQQQQRQQQQQQSFSLFSEPKLVQPPFRGGRSRGRSVLPISHHEAAPNRRPRARSVIASRVQADREAHALRMRLKRQRMEAAIAAQHAPATRLPDRDPVMHVLEECQSSPLVQAFNTELRDAVRVQVATRPAADPSKRRVAAAAAEVEDRGQDHSTSDDLDVSLDELRRQVGELDGHGASWETAHSADALDEKAAEPSSSEKALLTGSAAAWKKSADSKWRAGWVGDFGNERSWTLPMDARDVPARPVKLDNGPLVPPSVKRQLDKDPWSLRF